ncbi:site-specific integrase, partial [Calderihabitans maritimus]|uniref:site-specific integrase n=1 Tax=Calderihabitans maritimus TaxID=1246530 RepID=UPI0018651C3E
GSLSPRAIEYLLAKYAYDARLEGVTPHVLRHTFCKSLIDAGESLDRVAVLAGHSNLNTTARYTRPSDKDLQRAVERLAWE